MSVKLKEIVVDNSLWVQGHATDHIWGMLHRREDNIADPASNGELEIGLRFDSGDAGTLYLNKHQAHDVIETLNNLLSQM